MPRKITAWTAEEACPIYWMVMWGHRLKDIRAIVSELIPTRSLDAIGWMCGETKKFLTEAKGIAKIPNRVEVGAHTKRILREASKMEPPKAIATMRQEVEFMPWVDNGPKPRHSLTKSPKFEQTDENPPRKNEPREEKYTRGHPLIKEALVELGKQFTDVPLVNRLKEEEAKTEVIYNTYTLEEVLILAKKYGATEVIYGGFIIRLR